jgi:predicted nucleic acid-binding protein
MNPLPNYFEEKFLHSDNPNNFLLEGILVDADALVALYKTNDNNHKKAKLLSDKYQQKGANYYVSPFTIAEAVTVLSYKTSQTHAIKFLKHIRKIDLQVFRLNPKDKFLPDTWFKKQTQKDTSYFDCYNLALLDKYKKDLPAIFSFDQVYKKNGFTLLQDL